MKAASESRIDQHNRTQRGYFGEAAKPTMVPADTPYVRRHVEELLACGRIGPGDRVLELGCGMGRYTLPLAARGVRVEGMDLTPFVLEKLAEFNGRRFEIPLHSGDILDHDPALDGRFDAVIGFFTLHHLHDLEASFAAMKRLLRPGGQVLFLEPNAWNVLFYVQIWLSPNMRWEGDKGVAAMRRGFVFRQMRRAGLQSPAVRRFGFFPPFLVNRPWGCAVERVLEKVPVWRPFLPFQLFRAVAP